MRSMQRAQIPRQKRMQKLATSLRTFLRYLVNVSTVRRAFEQRVHPKPRLRAFRPRLDKEMAMAAGSVLHLGLLPPHPGRKSLGDRTQLGVQCCGVHFVADFQVGHYNCARCKTIHRLLITRHQG